MRSFPTHLRISNRNACHTNTVTSRAKCVLPNKLAVKEVHELLDKRHHRLSLACIQQWMRWLLFSYCAGLDDCRLRPAAPPRTKTRRRRKKRKSLCWMTRRPRHRDWSSPNQSCCNMCVASAITSTSSAPSCSRVLSVVVLVILVLLVDRRDLDKLEHGLKDRAVKMERGH